MVEDRCAMALGALDVRLCCMRELVGSCWASKRRKVQLNPKRMWMASVEVRAGVGGGLQMMMMVGVVGGWDG